MAEIIDQIVKISIEDAISSVSTVDVNTLAIAGRNGTFTARVVEITPTLKSGAEGAEGSKKVTVGIGDESFEITTSANDTVADVIDDLVSAINNASTGSALYTATDGATKLTLTAKSGGWEGSEITASSADTNIVLSSSSVVETTAGVGTTVAFNAYSAEMVGKRCGTSSEIYAMAVTLFNQDSQPSSFVCIPLANNAANDSILAAVKTAANSLTFYHVVVATNDAAFAKTLLTDTTTGWQSWLATSKKVAHIQVSDVSGLKNHGCDRVAIYKHAEAHGTSKEFLNAAIVAIRCAKDSARGSFAHKKVNGITADSYDSDSYAEMIEGGINIYLTVSNESRLFMGSTGDKDDFIDEIIKDDWIRFNVQSSIFKLLGEANDGYGVNYDDAGIASVAASVLNVLNVSADTDHQYIIDGSAKVDYKPYSYLVANYPDDVRNRNLPLVTGSYARMNSIHTVKEISLQVTL